MGLEVRLQHVPLRLQHKEEGVVAHLPETQGNVDLGDAIFQKL